MLINQLLKNKRIVLIDDSLVRGTTSHKIVKMLYDAGAKEVHVKLLVQKLNIQIFMVWIHLQKKNYLQQIKLMMKFVNILEQNL